jgi:glycosyltransferase involved in cell wall biosynthesis
MHNVPDQTNSAWITWEIQVRNRSMSKVLNIPLYEITSDKPRLIRYFILVTRTVAIILKNNIKFLFVQNPSIVLSFFAVFLKPILGLKIIVDAHNSGIYPLEGKSKTLNFIARFICKKADHVIVTNSYLAETVTSWGGAPLIVPDPVPDFSHHQQTAPKEPRPYFLFICTWASDEPYTEVINAAAVIEDEADLYITGNFKKKLTIQQQSNMPPNVKLLGFVSEDSYLSYFKNALAAIDLTTRDNCLVCGAYEAIALNIPCIVSDSIVNREVFAKGFVYTKNTAPEIAASIQHVLINSATLKKQIQEQHTDHTKLINEKIKDLKSNLFSKAQA